LITFFPEQQKELTGLFSTVQKMLRPIEQVSIFLPLCHVLATEFPKTLRVGLIASTSSDLIEAWDACIYENKEPMVLHFPTAKLSRIYWNEEMSHAIQSVGLDLIICADEACAPDCDVPVIMLNQLKRSGSPQLDRPIPKTGAILQMSSGTTGHRKGIRYTLDDIRQHVLEYNKILGLTPKDRIISWLPLYHDMGYIAAFIMPRILGIDVVLMDPMDWVRQPKMLFDAIDKTKATICFMPNFGFEVMARQGRSTPSMRLWISCSEPTRAQSMRRFMDANSTPLGALVNCWGMAENIFAVAQSTGINVKKIDGVEVVSCGKPIPGTDVKIVDGEIYVRSAYALKEYIGVELQIDSEGYYATGDMGTIIEGEIFLQGRKKDIINNGGRKTLLSDLDFAVGEELPGSAGRIATFAQIDENLGTEIPIVLIEDQLFWTKNKDADLNKRVLAKTGIESTRAYFVPPKFITKTSSGKVNRRATGKNWDLAMNGKTSTAKDEPPSIADAESQITQLFPFLDFDKPIHNQIDSLGLVNLSILLSQFGIRIESSKLTTINAALAELTNGSSDQKEVIKIVSLTDSNIFKAYGMAGLQRFAENTERPVQFQHVCAPPAEILLSDIIFSDYFLNRDDDSDAYSEFRLAIDTIKNANILIIDDSTHLIWPLQDMLYPKLSHDFQADKQARLLGVRWALYSGSHDLLPIQLVEGKKLTPHRSAKALDELGDYLNIPVIRVAYGPDNEEITKNWEVQSGGNSFRATVWADGTGIDHGKMTDDLELALLEAAKKAPIRMGKGDTFFNFDDQPHWCSWLIQEEFIDFILKYFKNIVVLGKKASVPYLKEQAEKLGIRLTYRLDLIVPDDCDCVVQAGSWGKPDTDKPVFQIMAAGWEPGPVANVSQELQTTCPASRLWG
jgi:acyl-CoA synthetase (AMP-forming)/AMP-acid ligase II